MNDTSFCYQCFSHPLCALHDFGNHILLKLRAPELQRNTKAQGAYCERLAKLVPMDSQFVLEKHVHCILVPVCNLVTGGGTHFVVISAHVWLQSHMLLAYFRLQNSIALFCCH
jgi:hypothetical protein